MHPTIEALCTRINNNNKGVWNKLLQFLLYVNRMRKEKLILSVNYLHVMKFYVDYGFYVHVDLKSCIGGIITYKRGSPVSQSRGKYEYYKQYREWTGRRQRHVYYDFVEIYIFCSHKYSMPIILFSTKTIREQSHWKKIWITVPSRELERLTFVIFLWQIRLRRVTKRLNNVPMHK